MRAEELLPDDRNYTEREGITIRKGSVGAFLENARTWSDANASDEDRKKAERDIIELLPALRALGLFEAFSIRNEELRRFVDAWSGAAKVGAENKDA